MKKVIAFVALFLLIGCSTPPEVTITPTTKGNPASPTNTPAVTITPSLTGNPAGPTNTPAVPPADAPFLPNPAWQPGVLNPDVTQDDIQTTICVSGYTAKIRPPVSYTDKLKVQQIAQYGYADTTPSDYEEDHLISLEVGGSPTDPKNLWPQPRHSTPFNASTKDTLENTLKGMICSGQITLATAQRAIATDWVAAYHLYIGQSIIPVTPEPTEP